MVNVKPKGKTNGRKSAPRKGRRAGKKITFAKRVQQVLASQTENKHSYFSTGDTLTYFNSGINSAADMNQVLPSISIGTADNQRIGDELNGKRLRVKGFMRLTPKAATGTVTNDPKISNVVARLMIVSMKNASNFTTATNSFGNLTSLLRKGGTTTAFTGTLSDIYADINTDVFTVHHNSVHYLTQDYVFVPSSSAAYVNAPVAMDIKDSIKFFNIDVKCKKTMKYDSVIDGGIRPTNFAPFLVMGYSYLSGDSPDVVNTQVALQYISEFIFEDN